MKPVKTFIIGSRRFFENYPDYVTKDEDELCVMDNFPLPGNVLNLKKDGKDVFFYRDMDKEGFIRDTIDSKVPMRVGKFLIPEFCESIGFTVDDFARLDGLFNQLDSKHLYERLIRDAYIENGGFFLTDGQRDAAYREYRRSRGL